MKFMHRKDFRHNGLLNIKKKAINIDIYIYILMVTKQKQHIFKSSHFSFRMHVTSFRVICVCSIINKFIT